MIKNKHFTIKLKRMLIVIFTVLLGCLLTYSVLAEKDKVVESNYVDVLREDVRDVCDEYNRYFSDAQIYHDNMCESVKDIVGIQAFYYEKNGFTSETREIVTRLYSDYGFLYYYSGGFNEQAGQLVGRMINDPRKSINLNDEQLLQLFYEGHIEADVGGKSHELTISPVGNKGYAIMMWNEEDLLEKAVINGVFDETNDRKTVVKINSNSGLVEDSNREELIGTDFNNLYDVEKLKDISIDGGYIRFNDGRRGYLCADQSVTGSIVCAYMMSSDISYRYIRNCIVPILLGWVTLLLIMGYALKFNKVHSDEEKSEIAYLHIYKDIYTDGRLVYHTIALGIFAIVVVASATLYIHSLVNYSNNSVNTRKDLNTLENMYKNDKYNKDEMVDDFDYMRNIVVNGISEYYLNYPEQISEEGNLQKLCDKLPDIRDITIYDETGTIEYDTNNHIGYTLSRDENSSEYVLWELIEGDKSIEYYNGTFGDRILAGRRQDKSGIVQIQVVLTDYLRDVFYAIEIEDILKSARINSKVKGYINNSCNEEIHYIIDNNEQFLISENALSDSIISGTTTLVEEFGDTKILIDLKNIGDYTLVIGNEVVDIYGLNGIRILFGIALVFIFQQIMILLLSMRHKEDKPLKEISIRDTVQVSEDFNEKLMDDKFRKLIRNLFVIACCLVIVVLVVDLKYASTPILKYLFDSRWEKGFNLFSITMLLIIVIGGTVLSSIVQSVIILFTSNMGPRGLTIGRMTSSLVKFAFLIAILILMLYNLGVNPSALLAGAGIVGAMISFCAQQTINDMLSGFLIVFENLFNIGDWITVDDFRGQVCEIGIRSTKLRISNTYKIFNNSELRKITIMEENGKGAICLVDIAYKEDLNKVIELIKSSEERYRKDIPDITLGPKIDGILELGDSGVTMRIWAHTDISKVLFVERELRRVTKNILDENDIEIPFNQVTIHTAD